MQELGIIIQARMGSTRLPGKVLLPLPLQDGKPMLEHIMEGFRRVPISKSIVVATSTDPEDDVIESFCRRYDVECFRGAKDDVLSRYQQLASRKSFSSILRYTADNPFVDPDLVEKAYAFHLKNKADLTITEGLPLGIHLEFMTKTALLNLPEDELSEMDKEHVTFFMKDNPDYKTAIYKADLDSDLQNLRVTVDYPSDYLVASAIISLGKKITEAMGVELISKVFINYPWIFKANSANLQKNAQTNLSEEIKEAVNLLEKMDYKRAANVLKSMSK